MKKRRKGNLLKRMIAVLLSVAMIVETSQDAGSINVLAAEAAAQSDRSCSGTDWTFDNDGKLTIVSDEGMADWCSSRTLYTPYYQEQVVSIELQNVTGIGEDIFSNCSKLTSIEIPSGVTSIGKKAFYNCSSLTSIEIPSGVTSIGEDAFYNCSSLTSIEIPSGVTSIEADTFNNCSSLASIEIPSGVTSIGEDAFRNCSSLASIEIPSGVTSIGEWAFYNCSSLTSIEIPSGVTSIGASTFETCISLTSIEIPSGVTHIWDSAFCCCYSLTDVTIPSSVTYIGSFAFCDCHSLTDVTIPSDVNYIGSLAFMNCSSMISVTMQPARPPKIDESGVFSDCKFVKDNTKGILVPVGTEDSYKKTENWKTYQNYITDGTPEITAQPMDQSVKNGEKATFSVTAAGAAGYQWQVNEDGTEESGFRDIANAASAIYTVSAVDKSYNGYRYRCVVTNERGSVTSNVAELTVTDSDAEKVAAAKAVVDTVLEGYTASNSSTKQDIQEKINAALTEAEITEVTVTVGELTKKDATESEGGRIDGSIKIQCGEELDTVLFSNGINILPHTHSYGTEWKYDSEYHWHECIKCDDKTDYQDHRYDSDNDMICNICDYDRTSLDKELPTGTITIETDSWTSFLNTITFGLFFKETKRATIEAQDTGSGVDKIYYYVSDSALSESEVKALREGAWTAGDSVSISPDRKCVIYAKITDKAGNTAYLSSDGLVFDETAPVISGVTDGQVYRTPQTVTVTDAYLKSVKVDGKEVTLNDGQFILEAVSGEQTVSATDQAGNITTVTVTVKTEAENLEDAGQIAEDTLEDMPITEDTSCTEIESAIIAALITAGIMGLTVDVTIAEGAAAGAASIGLSIGMSEGISNPSGGGSESGGKNFNKEIEKELHTHSYGIMWKSNQICHWHQCSCGARAGMMVHGFGEWTVTKLATENEEGARERRCVICGYKDSEKIPKTTHTHSYGSEWESDDTNHWHECSCGAKAEEAAHSFGEWVTIKSATEKEYGVKERSCVVCGYMEIEIIFKTAHTHSYGSDWKTDGTNHWHECGCGAKAEEAAHSFGEWVTIKSATEDEYGIRERICVVCGYKETEVIPKTTHTHSYGSDWKTDGTNHWHECSNCGAKSEESAHSFGEWTTIKSATEDEYGIKERICEICQHKETEVIPETTHTHSYGSDWKTDGTNHWHECGSCGAKSEEAAHSFGEWTTIKSATEDEYGIRERICEICQYKETEVIPETAHTHSYGSDWKTDRTNHWHECGCGAKAEEATHSFGEWATIRSATEDKYGIRERSCVVCGYREIGLIPKTTHTHSYGSDWKTDRTNHWHECGCGAKYEESTHSYGAWTVIRSATEDKYGIRERSCVVCGYREIGLIPKTTHMHSYGSDWKSDRTNHWHECSCGAKSEESTHSYGVWTVIKPATEDEYGIRERNCAVCGYKETEVIPETTHTHSCESDWKSDGTNHWHECSSCGGKVEEAAHNFGEWTVTKSATEDEYGIRERNCAVCGYKETEVIPETTHTHSCESDWKSDGTNHWHECSRCGGKVEEAAHSFGGWTVTKPAAESEEGIRERICAVCGYKVIEAIPITGGSSLPGTSAGKVDTDEQTDGKAPAIQISTSEKELEDILLTDAEKQQMANGTDVKIVLDVKDASGSVSSQDKTRVEGALNGYIVGQYLDISLHKLIGENRIDISETAGKIIITIAVPDSLKNTDSKVTRTFAVIRVHDGVAELLPDLDNNVDTITIETDRFSTYTIVYKDTENGENKGGNNNRDKGENNDNNGTDLPQTKDKAPETGDRTLSEWYVTLAMIAGFAYLILYFSKRRRGKTEETKKEMSD